MSYAQDYRLSLADPDRFWAQAATAISWFRKPTRVLDDTGPAFARWFADGTLNTCFNALDRHVVAGRGEQAALIYDSPVTGSGRDVQLHRADRADRQVRRACCARSAWTAGDRVLIYLPMVPEAVIAMLACARIGAVHSVVFGGFAAPELAARIDDAQPRVIVSASCGIEPSRLVAYKPLLDRALQLARHQPDSCVILQRPQLAAELTERDLDWRELMRSQLIAPAECVELQATDPLYILYTSGTTGRPKGIVRDNGGHAVALRWSMANIFDVGPGEVMLTASDVGWVVGHSYIVYAPLLTGATTVLYEGKPVGTPDAGALWRLVAEHRVKVLFTSPTALRAVKRDDPDGELVGRYDLSTLRDAVPGRRAAGPGDLRVGQRAARHPGGRPLVADRDRLADRRQPAGVEGLRADADQARLPDGAGARLRRADPLPRRPATARRPGRRDLPEAAAATRHQPGRLGRRPALRRVLPDRLPRLLPDRGRRLPRRRRLPVRARPHRRRAERGRPPAVLRPDRGGAGRPPGGRRVRGDRRRRTR